MTPFELAYGWMIALLNADATITGVSNYGGVADSVATLNTSRPMFLIEVLGSDDVNNVMGGYRLKSDLLLLLKAVAPSDRQADLDTLASRADVLLSPKPQGNNLFPIAYESGFILSCVRQRPHRLKYADQAAAGVVYSELGGAYALEVLV